MRKSQLYELLVPLIFFVISVAAMSMLNRYQIASASQDTFDRIFRNLFLVLSLIIPIVAGLGMNFGIVLGAMAGQIGLMIVENGEVSGIGGVVVAVICSIPIAMLLGLLTGLLFNRTPGREMITGIILGFFSAGIYQFLFLIMAGPVIPLRHPDLLLPQGMGLRVTVNLVSVERALDSPLTFQIRDVYNWGVGLVGLESWQTELWWGEIPVVTLLISVALCLATVWFLRTKLGQDLRAVGDDAHVAEVAGIKVNRCRIIAVMISMVLAGIGQIIFLQNMAVMNTFSNHEQTGFYAIASILVGGATVSRAGIGNAIVGTILFHAMIVSVSVVAQEKLHSPQLGEYLREFVTFGIIGTTLAIYAWKGRRPAAMAAQAQEVSGTVGGE